MRNPLPRSVTFALACLGAAAALTADEGMWTYDNPPLAALKQKYGFEPTTEWLDHLRLASVRFMDGGSGSFVSADGLMITNHHVGLGCIQNVSSEGKDYVKDGFFAATRGEEVACPGYEVNVLASLEDVTSARAGEGHAADGRRRGARGAQGRDRRDRERVQREDRPALRRGDALPGGRVPALPLQEVHGRPPRLRPGAVDGLLRRRPRQLHVPAPRPRHLPHARVRERPAREAGRAPALEHGRDEGGRPRLRLRQPRLHVPARDDGARSSTCATRRSRSGSRATTAG